MWPRLCKTEKNYCLLTLLSMITLSGTQCITYEPFTVDAAQWDHGQWDRLLNGIKLNQIYQSRITLL